MLLPDENAISHPRTSGRHLQQQKSLSWAFERPHSQDFLTHLSQINWRGEALQTGSYRLTSQFGLELLAQLKAALEVNNNG